MIIQMLMDALSQFLGELVQVIEPFPAEVGDALDAVATGGAALGSAVAKFDPIIPWQTIGGVLTAWLAVMGFWLATLALRLVLWGFGR